uniref:Uncharacterized protein n=1 Tax=Populus alba TaxID=43335 RepID=A0A4U5QMK1_POPAL|nr:hypothetical protein D5086_0000072640 [Populus alba]
MQRPVHEELERWKAVKFPVPKDYVLSEPNKILQKEVYTYAKEDNFNALFGLLSDKLEHVSSEEVLDIIFKHVAASGNSLLHVAASHGSEDVIQLLCHHFPLLITRKNFLGDNALHLAARAGRFATIQNLVKHVKIHHRTLELASLLRMKNNKGNTPLHDAVIKGCREVACFLVNEDLEVSYHKNKEDKSPLYLAVESCDGEMLASFIEAVPEGNLEKLAVGKPDIMLPEDIKGGNLLHLAASMGFLSGARLLVSRCPVAASQRNDEGNLPIHVACQKGHLEVVRELLSFWLDPMDFLNENRQNILHVAAESGQMKIVDEILRNRDLEALINEKDYDGNTPLHLAAMYGRPEIVQALVSDKRVDKRIVNNEKLKPSGVVAKLLQGGRIEAPKSDGMPTWRPLLMRRAPISSHPQRCQRGRRIGEFFEDPRAVGRDPRIQELGARKPNSPSPQTATHLFFSSSISPQPITKTTASHQIFSLFLTEPHCPDDPLPLIFFLLPPGGSALQRSTFFLQQRQLLLTADGPSSSPPTRERAGLFPSPQTHGFLLRPAAAAPSPSTVSVFPFDLFHNNRPAADLIASHSSPDTAPTEANRRSATLLLHD